jgi:hypothetical protein
MSTAALFVWMATVLVGLVLLIVWLMEYDREFQSAAATRLPVPVISTHALLGIGGLMVWGFYLVGDEEQLAWGTVADLAVVVLLGLIMAARWIGVYRAYAAPDSSPSTVVTVPPERYFPRSVVAIHGILAAATLVLVVLSVLFDGS